eukprot:COSAG02_NODE_80_length_40128_cov_591.169002_30_plen_134_part_00
MDTILTQKFTRFLMQRADKFIILRRKAVKGYNISFLVTNAHMEYLIKSKLIDFIIKFMEDVDKEISDMKITGTCCCSCDGSAHLPVTRSPFASRVDYAFCSRQSLACPMCGCVPIVNTRGRDVAKEFLQQFIA